MFTDTSDLLDKQQVKSLFLFFYFILGVVRIGVCSASPWTGGQCFQVTQFGTCHQEQHLSQPPNASGTKEYQYQNVLTPNQM